LQQNGLYPLDFRLLALRLNRVLPTFHDLLLLWMTLSKNGEKRQTAQGGD